MINTSFNVQDLLSRSADLLSEIKGEPVAFIQQPIIWTYKCAMVLTPEEFTWQDTVVNLYDNYKVSLAAPEGITVIYHGHARDKVCTAQTLCHTDGYSPVGRSANFMKRWREKWCTTTTVDTA
ncbi:MAG: hypothetical protein ABWY25_11750 [Paenisporosarcina sp.]